MIIFEGVGTRLKLLTLAISNGFSQVCRLEDNECSITPEELFPSGLPGIEFLVIKNPPYPKLQSSWQRLTLIESWKIVYSVLKIQPTQITPNGLQFRGWHLSGKNFPRFSKNNN